MRSIPTSVLTGVALMAAVTSTALAANVATFKRNGISFTYPSNWQVVPQSYAKSLGQELVHDSHGVVKLGAVGGVDQASQNGNQACVAILTKMVFTPAFQKNLKGNHKKFLQEFTSGIKGTAKKIISQGTEKFAGQSNAFELQALIANKSETTRAQFLVAISSDNKTVDMAIFVVTPVKSWGHFSGELAGIAGSSRFKG